MTGQKRYTVTIRKKVLKGLVKLPHTIQRKLHLLVNDLRDTGPHQPHWPNYSKFDESTFHCHLGRKWCACWQHDKGTVTIEVYYAGSRENAPY